MTLVRRLTLLIALLGSAAMGLSGGGLLAAAALSAAVILGCAMWLPQPGTLTIERWRLVNLTLLLVGMILLAVRVDPLSVIAGGLALLAAHRAWTAVSVSGLQALLLIAALQVMLASGMVASPWMPVAVGALVVLAPAGLAVISLSRFEVSTALLGAGAGSLGLLIAAMMPPPPGPALIEEIHAVGFSREIALGDLSPLHDDLTPLLTLTLPDAPTNDDSIYLHGITLDRFTGSGWASTAPQESVPLPIDLVGRALIRQQIHLEPLTEGVLPGIAPMASIEDLDGTWRDDVGTWRVSGALRPVRYTAYSLDPAPDLPPTDRGRWLGLPADLDPQIRTLAAELTVPGGPQVQADHLIAWLRDGFTYTRIPAPQTARQPLSDFLFVTRTGHCEYFAASLAVLLRAQGVESRVVSGLRGGEEGDDGARLFRQRDAHAWVEVYATGAGWLRLDPTPPADRDAPMPPALREATVLPVLPPVSLPWKSLLLVGLIGSAIFVGLRIRRSGDPCLRLYRQARRQVRRRGWEIPPSLPPVAAADWLIAQVGPPAQPMLDLAWALYRYRYGEEPAALSEAAAALRLLRRIPKRS
ncbi:MAG: hypothetical protein ACI8RZ_007070 [Myxococcota bacterium]